MKRAEAEQLEGKTLSEAWRDCVALLQEARSQKGED